MGKTANYPLPIKTVHTIIVLWIQLIQMKPGAQLRRILMESMSMELAIMDSVQITATSARMSSASTVSGELTSQINL